MSEEKVLITVEGLEKIKAELDNLRSVDRPAILERLHAAKELSDTVDNADYEEARNEQAFVEGRILTLEKMLKNAEVMPIEKSRSSLIKFGSRVTVQNEDGEKKEYLIVGKAESDPREGKISNESPVGKALLGKRTGDTVEVQAPKGLIKLKIVSVSKK